MHIDLISTDNDIWALGIRCISSVLRREGHTTRIFILPSHILYTTDMLETLAGFLQHTDLIALSCLSRGSDKAHQIGDHLRYLGKPIVWGGLHATLNPEECLDSVDLVCRGEGERMMVEYTRRLQSGDEWHDIPNIAYRRNGTVVMNPLGPLVEDLSSLPLFDFTCTDEYRLEKDELVRISSMSEYGGSHEIPFTGSRGCSFSCTYCCNSTLKELYSGGGRYIRKMDMANYVNYSAELLRYFSLDHFQYFHFLDEDFLAHSIQELRDFSTLYLQKIGLPFQCMGSPAHVTKEKIDMLVEAGLWRFHMGIESGSERTKREVYNRRVSNESVRRAVEILNQYPQVVQCHFVIAANPYEDRDDLLETIRFLSNLKPPFFLRMYSLVFFPGSLLYERARNDGIITGKEDSGYELDFIGELQYKSLEWKRKNLYLNGLLFLMDGRCGRMRMGLVPRFFLPFLTSKSMIDLCDRYPIFMRILIKLKLSLMFVRSRIGTILKRVVKDPRRIYHLVPRMH